MNIGSARASGASEEEIAALIATLNETLERLDVATGGEIDAVVGPDGGTFLLRRAQEQLRASDAAREVAILGAIPAHIALIDGQGAIVSANRAWQDFAEANGLPVFDDATRINYLDACETGGEGKEAAAGIRSVLAATSGSFSLEYPCHTPTQQRWFLMTVTPLSEGHGDTNGAVVMHMDITDRKQAEQKLQASRQRLDGIVSSSMDGIITVDADHRIVLINPAAERMFGYSAREILGQGIDMLMPERFRAGHAERIAQFGESGVTNRRMGEFGTVFAVRKDQGTFPIEVAISHDRSSGNSFFIATLRDVTEQVENEQKIRQLNRVHSVMAGITSLIVHAVGRDELFREACRIAVENGGFRMAMIGLVDGGTGKLVPVASAGKDEALMAMVRSHLTSDENASATMAARTLISKTAIVSNDVENDPQALLRQHYTRAGVSSLVVLPLIAAGQAVGVLVLYASEKDFFHALEMELLTGLADDVALAIAHFDRQDSLTYLASHDPLTGLANRRLLLQRLAQRTSDASRAGRRVALALIDLERFKNINDTLGQPAGDSLLQQVSAWLAHSVGDIERVARIGSDHFAVVLREEERVGDSVGQLEAMMEALLLHPFRLKGDAYRISAKFGVAIFPDDGADAGIVFRHAEAALKQANAAGFRHLFYTREMTETVAQRTSMENRLRHALEKDEFTLHYQPKVDLASGGISGVEALIRWNDPLSGLVAPGLFIPILEDTGLIYDVGLWALRQSLRDHIRWRGAGLQAVRIAVNVSPLQMRHPGFIAALEQTLAMDSRAAQGLELEITESMIMGDTAQAISSLHAIRALGLCIAIDDFGTGFSSLGYLSKLPIDTLKIDRMFVADMATSQRGLSLVSTIINLAHSLGLRVVAEGVETEEQSRLLRVLKCDEMQGYVFSRPVPAAVLEEKFLKRPAQAT